MNRNGYTALTASERRKDDDWVPYGWHIDVPGTRGDFVLHSETQDYAYAKQRAVDLHSTIIVPVFRERRKFG